MHIAGTAAHHGYSLSYAAQLQNSTGLRAMAATLNVRALSYSWRSDAIKSSFIPTATISTT